MPSRRFVIVLAMLLLAPAGVQAADEQAWGFYPSREDARLFYGVAESEAVTLSFICERKTRRLTIVSTVLPKTPKAGQRATIELRGAAKSASYAGVLAYERREETFHFEAVTAARPQVFDPLRSGASLEIRVAGARETVPLAGLHAPLAKMEAACFSK